MLIIPFSHYRIFNLMRMESLLIHKLFSNSTAIRNEEDDDDSQGRRAITSPALTSEIGDESGSSELSRIVNSVSMTDSFSPFVKYDLFPSENACSDVDRDPSRRSILSYDRDPASSSDNNRRANRSTLESINVDHSYCTSASDGEELASTSRRHMVSRLFTNELNS